MLGAVKGWFGGSLCGLRGVNRADGLIALVLSAFGIALTSGLEPSGHPHGGFWASVAMLAVTMPVLWRRRAPLAAVATLAVGSLFNGLVIGSMVRCGAALPALGLVMFSVGLRCELRRALGGAALGVIAVVALAQYDPNLTLAFGAPGSVLLLALWGVGRLVRSRESMVASLRERTRELGEQRERTAQLAVAAERAHVAAGVDDLLQERIGALAGEAARGRGAVDEQPELAREMLSTIEHEGRRTLSQMREIVGSLRDDAPVDPQPGLTDLDGLLERATTADVRLRVDGDRRGLPAGLELSGYRIVEHLLTTLQDTPEARVDVTLSFADDALEIAVAGPPRADFDTRAALAGAREWVALHGGQLEEQARAGRSRTVVRLPLVTAYA
ncbi:MAG TPA: histidine kinase [Solirubrobacteraceae bacterium]